MRLSSNARILCVDDDRDSCELLKCMLSLSDSGYLVETASNGKEALSLIKSGSFDLYILDYALPEISGVDLCREIRRSDLQTPILFFSAMAREYEKDNAFKAGATEYLVKPNDLDKLTATVEKLVSQASLFFQNKLSNLSLSAEDNLNLSSSIRY